MIPPLYRTADPFSSLKAVKGGTSRAFFRAFPHLRKDLLGGYLWSESYHWVPVTSHTQFKAAIEYIQANRSRAGLPTVPSR
ncbi:MAG: transposase [Chloroflexota bacterium]